MLIILVALLCNGCAIYRVDEAKVLNEYEAGSRDLKLELGPENTPHCLGILMVLTAGIIPDYCPREYVVNSSNETIANVRVTHLIGWASLLVVVSPNWHRDTEDFEEKVIGQAIEAQ